MITLLSDAVTALLKRRQAVDDVPPACAPDWDGTGGHSPRDTSELLNTAAGYLRAFRNTVTHTANGPFLEALDELDTDLRDRAAQLAAVGD